MRRKSILLALLAAMLLPMAVQAQEDVEQFTLFPNATTNCNHAPFYPAYTDILYHTEFYYTADMLSELAGMRITTLRYYLNSDYSFNFTATIKMYAAELETFSLSAYNFDITSTDNLVYSGTMQMENGVLTIELDSPIDYSGGDLAFAVGITEANGNCTGFSYYFQGQTVSYSSVITGWNSAYYLSAPNNNYTNLPKTTFFYTAIDEDACLRPTNIAVSSVGSDEATLSWVARDNHTAFEVLLPDSTTDVVYDTFYTFTDLTPNSTYSVGVRALCGSDESPYTMRSFTTTAVPYSGELPLATGFESGEESNTYWQILNGAGSNAWAMGSAVNNGGSQALYISNNGGTDNAYSNSSSSVSYATLPIQVDEAGTYTLSFDWRSNGESGYDYLRAWLATGGVEVQGGQLPDGSTSTSSYSATISPAGWTPVGGRLQSQQTWQTIEQEIEITTPGVYTIVLMWANDGSAGSNPPAAVDNLYFGILTCPMPAGVQLTATDATTSSLTLSWPAVDGVDSWGIRMGDDDYIETADTFYTFTGLDANTAYQFALAVICDEGDTSRPVQTSFRTACDIISASELPFIENFDSYASSSPLPSCWTGINLSGSSSNTSPYPYSYAGHQCLYLYTGNATQPTYALTPQFENVGSLMVTFEYYSYDYADVQMTVGVMTSPYDTSTFTPIQTYTLSDNQWHEAECHLTSFSGDGYIAFRAETTTGSAKAFYIDNVQVGEASSCPRPQALTIGNVSDEGATLVVGDPAAIGSYRVTLTPAGGTATTADYTTDSIALTGLSAQTTYTVLVAAICTDGTVTSTISTTFTTACGAVQASDLPLTMNFEGLTSGTAAPDCWTRVTPYPNYPQVSSTSATTDEDGNHLGNMVYYMYTYNYADAFLVSPYIASLEGMGASAYTRNVTSSHLTLGLMTSPTDTASFLPLVGEDAPSGSWLLVETPFAGVEDLDSYHYVAFRCTYIGTGSNGGLYIDNLRIGPMSGCAKPTDINATDISEDGATLTWNGTAVSYTVSYTVDGTAHTETVTDNSITLTGLSGSTGYQVQITATCDDEEVSQPVNFSFRTLCSTITELPWTEDFSSYSTSSHQLPDCWDYESSSSSSMPYVSSNASTVGQMNDGNYLCISTSNGSYGPNGLAVLPPFDYDLDQLQIQFNYAFESADRGPLTIGYVTGSNFVSDYVAVDTVTPSTAYALYQFSYATVAGIPAGARLAIYYNHNNSPYYSVGIDNIVVSLADTSDHPVNPNPNPEPEPCDAPTDVTASVTTDNVTIYWTATGDYEVALANGSSWSEPAAADIQQVSASPYTWNGLVPNTTYTVGVRQVCDDNNHSDWVTRTVTTNEQVGIDAVDATAAFALYPNPASGSVSITGFEGQVTIVDLNGREVMTAQVGDTRASIDISSLPAGAYFVRLTADSATAVRKLIVR